MPISNRSFKLAGMCGVAFPIVAFSSIFFAMCLSPWFDWWENPLSDLGVNGSAALLFSAGLMAGGILASIFALGLFRAFRGRILARAGALVLTLASVAVFGVGLFPASVRFSLDPILATAWSIHTFFAVMFFVLFPISLLLIGSSMVIGRRERLLGSFAILSGFLALSPWVFPWDGLAIPEAIAGLIMSGWAVVLGLKLYWGNLGS